MNKRLMQGRESMIRNEISILKKVSQGHANILTLVDYFETMNNLYLITELAIGGELFDRICDKGSFFESDAAQIIYTIVDAVKYLHDNGIVHRDLKPENLLFKTKEEDSPLVIGDFGLSRITEPEAFSALTTTCGTPGYMAPEIFLRTGHGKPVDMWAIGVITYFLLCGYPPFDQNDESFEVQSILNGEFSFEPEKYWCQVSETAKKFIRLLLVVKPEERLTAQQALNHPWLLVVKGGVVTGEEANADKTAAPAESNLLPSVRENFNARKTFRKAVGLVKAINKMKTSRAPPVDEELHPDGEAMVVHHGSSGPSSPI
ncbi:Calcium/calmodulin-dependent protein kinase type I [Entomophthora muscae]|uniref:Calcium/calmodulin-dependent protein kinase type I n=1 Tax=Entomophthora muscae TaxID=34485 RepID=A0ACC2T5Z8_9FUNG|nr:Calcium/calmodulin-dependent protein kinase type I [Entomophthora muscae]